LRSWDFHYIRTSPKTHSCRQPWPSFPPPVHPKPNQRSFLSDCLLFAAHRLASFFFPTSVFPSTEFVFPPPSFLPYAIIFSLDNNGLPPSSLGSQVDFSSVFMIFFLFTGRPFVSSLPSHLQRDSSPASSFPARPEPVQKSPFLRPPDAPNLRRICSSPPSPISTNDGNLVTVSSQTFATVGPGFTLPPPLREAFLGRTRQTSLPSPSLGNR